MNNEPQTLESEGLDPRLIITGKRKSIQRKVDPWTQQVVQAYLKEEGDEEAQRQVYNEYIEAEEDDEYYSNGTCDELSDDSDFQPSKSDE